MAVDPREVASSLARDHCEITRNLHSSVLSAFADAHEFRRCLRSLLLLRLDQAVVSGDTACCCVSPSALAFGRASCCPRAGAQVPALVGPRHARDARMRRNRGNRGCLGGPWADRLDVPCPRPRNEVLQAHPIRIAVLDHKFGCRLQISQRQIEALAQMVEITPWCSLSGTPSFTLMGEASRA